MTARILATHGFFALIRSKAQVLRIAELRIKINLGVNF